MTAYALEMDNGRVVDGSVSIEWRIHSFNFRPPRDKWVAEHAHKGRYDPGYRRVISATDDIVRSAKKQGRVIHHKF